MGWGLGWDSHWQRDVGYGVPAICDHPKCNARIDRGLAHVCCKQEPYGGYGERGGGCGLFFCGEHQTIEGKCGRCRYGHGSTPYKPKPDVREWLEWKLKDKSWKAYREENPEEVRGWEVALTLAPVHGECGDEQPESGNERLITERYVHSDTAAPGNRDALPHAR